jgi:hypothetical protein
MPNAYIVQSIWTGFLGAPGYTNFTFLTLDTQTKVDNAVAAVRTYFDSIKTVLLPAWGVQVQQSVKFYVDTTGHLAGAVSATSAPANVVGVSPNVVYTGGAGVRTKWYTNQVRGGTLPHSRAHVVVGSTFIVPYAGTWQNDGTPIGTDVTTMNAAATALRTSMSGMLCVWHRDWDKSVHPWKQVGGELLPVTGSSTIDSASGLRSRRT